MCEILNKSGGIMDVQNRQIYEDAVVSATSDNSDELGSYKPMRFL